MSLLCCRCTKVLRKHVKIQLILCVLRTRSYTKTYSLTTVVTRKIQFETIEKKKIQSTVRISYSAKCAFHRRFVFVFFTGANLQSFRDKLGIYFTWSGRNKKYKCDALLVSIRDHNNNSLILCAKRTRFIENEYELAGKSANFAHEGCLR